MYKHYWLRRKNLNGTICECICPLLAGAFLATMYDPLATPAACVSRSASLCGYD
jgi:hypothetical protein